MPSNRANQQPEYDSNEPGDHSSSTGKSAWHEKTTAQTLEALDTTATGLTVEEAQRRLALYGPNSFDLKVHRTPLRIFVSQFKDFMILILIAAAILSGIIGDIKDTVVIGIIVFLNGVIGFIQEYRAERALEALEKMAAPNANVIRGGKSFSIPAADL